MIKSSHFNEEKSQKKPMSNAERKKKQREKQKALKEGTYIKPLLEEAKEEILQTKNFNLAAILESEKFKNVFDSHQTQQLKTFINNHKPKNVKDQNEVSYKEQEQQNIKEKAQRLGNQQIPLLHQSLLTPQTSEERKFQIKNKIDENLFLFLQYMENQFSPSEDFLNIILELYDSFDSDTQTKLFVRVCAAYRGEILHITFDMVEAAMQFLIENKVDNLAAFGLLRLVFQNEISFCNYSIHLIQEFQQQYEQTILNFFKIIPQLNYQVTESLPATGFCFTKPIFKALKSGGDILHMQIPYQFLPYIIEIICYSFTENQDLFERFLEVFKLGCRKYYEILLQNDFSQLLHSIYEKTKTKNKLFFKNLGNSTQILEKAFDLIQQKKIEKFDEETIQLLIDINQEQYEILKTRPKIVKEDSKNQKLSIIKSILENNKHFNLDILKGDLQLQKSDSDIFKAMNISQLLFMQQLCFKFFSQINLSGRYFVQFDTGQGKTSLCLGLGVRLCQTYKKVFIINKSDDLTFKDFKKSTVLAQKLNQDIILVNSEDFSNIPNSKIIYLTSAMFLKYYKQHEGHKFKNYCYIIDEFDSIFFEKSQFVTEFIEIIQTKEFVIALTGSVLKYYHQQFIEKQLHGYFINFSLSAQHLVKPICQKQEVFTNSKTFQKEIVITCLNQTKLTPVIIILKENFQKIKNAIIKYGISVEVLAEKDPQQIESALLFFNEKQNNLFQVFLINENQGRGLDFVSSSEIEKNGGIYLVISTIPFYYLQFQQFIGRTGRIGSKGQYSVILLDKNAKNQNGLIYLNKKLSELQNNDLLYVSTLYSKNDIDSNQIYQVNNSQESYKQEEEEQQDSQLSSFQKNDEQKEEEKEFLNTYQVNKKKEIQTISKEQNKEKNGQQYRKYFNNTKSLDINKKRVTKNENKDETRYSKRNRNEAYGISEIDKLYFSSYEDPQIHEEMIMDKVRMTSYEAAIKLICNGKIIIDVGAGTGILSIFAAQAGAKHVFAIEFSNIAQIAKKNIRDNELQNAITIYQERAEDCFIPIEKADVIISEWMGYFLLFENMLPSVIEIRDRYLKEDGIMIPSSGEIFLAGFQKQFNHNGINLKSVSKVNSKQVRIGIISPDLIITNDQSLLDIDLKTVQNHMNQLETEIELEVRQSGILEGFVTWFNVHLIEGVNMSTSPYEEPTHWKQASFMLKNEVKVIIGEKVQIKFLMKPKIDNYRALQFQITYQTQSMKSKRTQNYILE